MYKVNPTVHTVLFAHKKLLCILNQRFTNKPSLRGIKSKLNSPLLYSLNKMIIIAGQPYKIIKMETTKAGIQNPLRFKEEKVLSFINNANSAEELFILFQENKDPKKTRELSNELLSKSQKGIASSDEIAKIVGKEFNLSNTYSRLFDRPDLNLESQNLENIFWNHGNTTMVQSPSEFSSVSRWRNGTRVTGFIERSLSSFIHCPIPTPTLSNGKSLYVDTVIALWRTSFTTIDDPQSPGVDSFQAEIWDGHNVLATNPPFDIIFLTNGYLMTRFNINSRRKVSFGLSFSFKQEIYGGGSFAGWAEYSSFGAEFITRNSIVVRPTETLAS